MAITDIVVSGKLFQDDGDPVEGATVQLLETGTTTVEATYTGGTTAAGLWTLTETSLDTTYDVKIASGTSVRYILWSDEIHLKGVDTSYLKVRGVEGAAAPIYFFADQADDAGDGWRMQASASDTLAIGSDKASAGTIIDYLTITNGASAAASLTTILGQLTVGVNDTGADVKFFGATAGSYWLWDESADGVVQIGTLTVGVDDAGHDVKFFGDTASAYMLWDASTDDLVLAGAAGIDLAGDIDVDGTANLDAVDIDGAVQIDATFTSGVDGQGYDTKFFGDTASAYILWDASADKLLTAGGAVIDIVKDKLLIGGTAVTTTAAELNLLDTASANSVVNSKAVIYGSSGELAGTLSTVAQGNVTSLGTLTTLTVDNIIINGTNIGHTSDTDAIAISSGGVVTMNQIPVFSAGINVSGGTIAGTLATAAQGNITSVGTLTDLTVSGTSTTIGTVTSGIWDAGAVTSSGVVTATGFTIGSAAITETELEILDGASGRFFSYDSEVGASGGTFNTAEERLFIPPGTDVTSAINLTAAGIVLRIGAQCNVQETITISAANCSVYCEGGVDIDGLELTSAADQTYVTGGGWDTVVDGGSANDAIIIAGDDCIVENIACQTTGGSKNAVVVQGARATLRGVKVIDSNGFAFYTNGAGAVDCLVDGCVVLGADSFGILAEANRLRVVNMFMTAAGSDGIRLDGGADNSVVVGCIIQDTAGADPIEVDGGAENCVIVGNRTDGAVNDGSGTSTVASNDEQTF